MLSQQLTVLREAAQALRAIKFVIRDCLKRALS
jgi:hypothetical protein